MTKPVSTYTIEQLGINNIADLALLHKAVYSREQVPGFFQKKYDTAYTGAKYIGYFAYNQHHQPIGFYGVIPTLLWYDGKAILAAQSADTMTHSDYRNLGLFTELANLTYALCKTEGVRLIFGFPNQNSLPGFINKLGWHTTANMDRFFIPSNPVIHLERFVHSYPLFKPAYKLYKNRVLNRYLKAVAGVPNSALVDGYNGVLRDAAYLRYKSYSATQVIQIEQSLFWIKLHNGLQIGDIDGIPGDFEKAMRQLSNLARKLGVDGIHFHTSPQITLHKWFAQHYEAMASYPVIFKDLGEDIATENIKFTLADIDIF
jgi:GNAT superfamily N-acetyltransferase